MLDSSFGGGGKVTTAIGSGETGDYCNSMVVQSDGKVVLAGVSGDHFGHRSLAMARYLSDGSLDISFGSGGKVFDITVQEVGLGLQSDGKIIIAGSDSSGLVLQRYNTDGSLDITFGSNGRVSTPNIGATAVAIGSDDKIVVTGQASGGSTLAVLRYNPDGSPDTNFGTGGLMSNSFGATLPRARAVAIQSGGKIVVAGTATVGGVRSFGIGRLNGDGSVDANFGSAGLAMVTIDDDADADALALQSDGAIVVAGRSFAGSNSHYALARFAGDGSLDGGFGSGGKVTTDIVNPDYAHAVAIQSDGKIVAAGSAHPLLDDFCVVRYNSDGTLDTTFGSGGKVVTAIHHNDNAATAVAIAGGKILAAGSARTDLFDYKFALVRYNGDGSLDSGFGKQGIVETAFGPDYGQDEVATVLVQGDGKIVAAGYSFMGTNETDFALARYNSDGSLDASFGTNGIVTTDFGVAEVGTAAALQGDGKIVVAGYSWNIDTYGTVFAVARYNADGTLDSSFGSAGKVTVTIGGGDFPWALAVQKDGKILVAGSAGGSSQGAAVVRLNPNGSLDSSFGSGGKVVSTFAPYLGGYYNELAIQNDGAIVAAGATNSSSGHLKCLLARYNSNGVLDTNFGSGGWVVGSFSGSDDFWTSTKLQSDGKIVVAGSTGNADSLIARYNADGSPDTSFGDNGNTVTDFLGGYDEFAKLALQSDGKIVAVGDAADASGTSYQQFALARFNSDGHLDTSFGSNGKTTTPFGSSHNVASSVAIQPDGKILAGGFADMGYPSWEDFALARYTSVNNAPTIGAIADLTIAENTSTGPLALNVGDTETSPAALMLAGSSSNTTLVPAANIVFGGSGANRIVTITPAANQTGTTTITLTVTDGGGLTASVHFDLTVLPGFAVSGRIADLQGMAVPNVTVSCSGTPAAASSPVATQTSTNSAGYFTLLVPNGSYTISPSLTNYTFTPAVRNITINNASVAGQNFTGKTGVSLSGRISTGSGAAIANVTVTRSGSSTPVLTNSAGYYTFFSVQPGSITVTPSKSGYRFTPSAKTVNAGTSNVSGQNFIGATGYSISGRVANASGVGQANINVKRTGSNQAALTNSAGYYTFTDVPDGTYTITAVATGTSFAPESRVVTISGGDISGQNFIAGPGYNIIGRISTSSGTPLAGVTVTRTGSAVTAVTNSAGYFVFSAVAPGTYTITPALGGHTFLPTNKTVVVTNTDISGQNFIGS
jgi:uncharacterized delta-60 repeat protein